MPVGDADFTQTPLYRALHSDRYARQAAISAIEEKTERTLIIYEANLRSDHSSLEEEDIQPFGDLLARIDQGAKIDLLLHSPGGNIEAAEKIIYMCRKVASEFRLVVPEYAKSAATLIALASDAVIMGLTSELGPIDAQITGPGPGGALFQTSAQSFIDKFEMIKKEVDETQVLSPVYFPLLESLNLGFLQMCQTLMERSEQFAAKWLKKHMLKDDHSKAEALAKDLCDVKKWLSHGVVIDAEEARNLGVNVIELTQDDALWKMIWYLHCCYGVLFTQQPVVKIFESATVSLPFQ